MFRTSTRSASESQCFEATTSVATAAPRQTIHKMMGLIIYYFSERFWFKVDQ
jgi:uncharacterized membrane protein